MIVINRDPVCVILETNLHCSVSSSSYAPIVDLHDAPGGSLQIKVDPSLDCLISELVQAQDTSVIESNAVGI